MATTTMVNPAYGQTDNAHIYWLFALGGVFVYLGVRIAALQAR